MEKRTCETCSYLICDGGGIYKSHPHCGHYDGPKSAQLVTITETVCEHHRTRLEKNAERIVYTSVDDAKSHIDSAPLDVLRLARQLEIGKQNRATLINRITARINKLERAAGNWGRP